MKEKDEAGTSLQTITPEGEFYETRIASPDVFRAIYSNLCANDEKGAKKRAKMRAARGGAPPFNKQLMIDSAQTYRNNVNDGSLDANLIKRDAALFALYFNTGSLIRVDFDPGTFEDTVAGRQVATIIERAYSIVFRDEPRLIEGAQRAFKDSNEAGVGFPVWTDSDDWRYKGVRRARITFNDSATTEPGTMELLFVADTMLLKELYDLVKNPEKAADLGWNMEALKLALINFFRDGGDTSDEEFAQNMSTAWDALENRILNNNASVMAEQYKLFSVTHGWVVEADGMVTHYILPYYAIAGETDFMFSRSKDAESMAQVTNPIPYDFGDGELRSVKSLAEDLYPMSVTSNRQLNNILDTTSVSGSFVLQRTGGEGNMEHGVTRAGPFTYIDQSLTPQNQAFAPKIDSMLAARSVLTSQMQQNTGMTNVRTGDPRDKSPDITAAQVRSDDAKEVEMEENRITLINLRMDSLHDETMRRILDPGMYGRMSKPAKKGVKRFRAICEAGGIPIGALAKLSDSIIVKVTRSTGGTSPAARLQGLIQGTNLTYASLSEEGITDLDREMGIILYGHDNVDRYIPPRGALATDSESAAFQGLENHDILEGAECLVARSQNHYAHAVSIGAMLQQYAQMFTQAPQQMERKQLIEMGYCAQFGISHFARHVDYLSKNPLEEKHAAEMQQMLEQLVPIYQQASKVLQQVLQDEENRRQQVEAENAQLKQQVAEQQSSMAIEQYKAQTGAQIKQMEAQWINEARVSKTETARLVANQKLMGQEQRANIAALETQQRANAETMAKIQIMLKESQAKTASKPAPTPER